MALSPKSLKPDTVPDTASIGHDAVSADERRKALVWCIKNAWDDADIGSVERVDEPKWKGWAMWSVP